MVISRFLLPNPTLSVVKSESKGRLENKENRCCKFIKGTSTTAFSLLTTALPFINFSSCLLLSNNSSSPMFSSKRMWDLHIDPSKLIIPISPRKANSESPTTRPSLHGGEDIIWTAIQAQECWSIILVKPKRNNLTLMNFGPVLQWL